MITRIEQYTPLVDEITGRKPDPAGGDLFQKVLTKAMSGSEIPQSSIAEAGSSSLSEIVSAGPSLAYSESDLEKTTEDLIKKLDNYSLQLGNANTSLRSLASVLEEINTSAQKLLREAETNPSVDSSLLSIARESAITASAEYIKFQRGDYLSPE